jgi:hypothetical protein
VTRLVIRRGLPEEFHWVQLGVVWRWKFGSWWAYNGLVRCTGFGPFRIISLRVDAAQRAEGRERAMQ